MSENKKRETIQQLIEHLNGLTYRDWVIIRNNVESKFKSHFNTIELNVDHRFVEYLCDIEGLS